MNIAVVGLGLIGGSFCKAIKKRTFHRVLGIDNNGAVLESALKSGAIDEIITPAQLGEANLTIICLYPEAIIDFVKTNADCFKKGSIVIDSCGIKEHIVNECEPVLMEKGVIFVGAHPMAGREFSGFEFSLDNLFDGASFIITETPNTPQLAIDLLQTLAGGLGFGKAVVCAPEKHDEVIAYTSQLAHVVSNAYVKSPTLLNFNGFSAGSFLDLTRVAKLNEEMWSSLFLCNKKALLKEIDSILGSITECRDAIADGDRERLRELLKNGRLLKEKSIELYKKDN